MMDTLIAQLQTTFPALRYTPGRQFCWSPESGEIFYVTDVAGQNRGQSQSRISVWSLLHETAHALLEHQGYRADVELLRLEVAAWQRARELAHSVGLTIDENHIEDCLDTYRDWLYKRSICPGCTTKCLQQDDFAHYRCFNCHTTWRVSASRFCRAYRSTTVAGASGTVSVL